MTSVEKNSKGWAVFGNIDAINEPVNRWFKSKSAAFAYGASIDRSNADYAENSKVIRAARLEAAKAYLATRATRAVEIQMGFNF